MNGKPRIFLRVLTYHRIAEVEDRPWLNYRLISATPAMFARQMTHLAQNFQVISIQQLLDAVRNGKNLPKRAVLITFDDAYRDFAENAWPVLKRMKLPATVFVPTAYPDQPQRLFWWDKLYQAIMFSSQTELKVGKIGILPLKTRDEQEQALKKVQSYIKNRPHEEAMDLVDEIFELSGSKQERSSPVLSWDELRELSEKGVTFGAHTQTHPILTRISLEEASQEITGSQRDLNSQMDHVLPIFSYPDGGHNQAIIDILKAEGFLLGFNGPAGVNDLRSVDLFRIRRINVTPKTTPFIFQLRLSPWFSTVEKFRLRKRIKEVSSTIDLD